MRSTESLVLMMMVVVVMSVWHKPCIMLPTPVPGLVNSQYLPGTTVTPQNTHFRWFPSLKKHLLVKLMQYHRDVCFIVTDNAATDANSSTEGKHAAQPVRPEDRNMWNIRIEWGVLWLSPRYFYQLIQRQLASPTVTHSRTHLALHCQPCLRSRSTSSAAAQTNATRNECCSLVAEGGAAPIWAPRDLTIRGENAFIRSTIGKFQTSQNITTYTQIVVYCEYDYFWLLYWTMSCTEKVIESCFG